MEKFTALISDPTILSACISAFASVILFWLNRKRANETKKLQEAAASDKSTKEQIAEFQENMLAAVKLHQDENKVLKQEISDFKFKFEELKARFDSIKNNLLTLNLFGSYSPIAMWIKDSQGKRLYHNQAYEVMTGALLSEVAGKSDYEIMKNKQISNNWDEADEKVRRTKAPVIAVELCVNINRPDNLFKVLTFKWPVFHNSKVVGIEGASIPLSLIAETFDINFEELEALI